MNIKSTQFELDVEANIKLIDKVVKTVLANADAGAGRTAVINDCTTVINDLRYQETDVLKFVDSLSSYTPALATYTSAEKVYRGPIEVGTDAASKTAILVKVTGDLNFVNTYYTNTNPKSIMSNKGATVNTFLTKSGTFNTKADEVLTKLASLISAVPVLATS